MSEWALLILIFWVFYGLNGFSWQRHARFYFGARLGRPQTNARLSSWSCFPPSPFGWRLKSDDVPFALAQAGIANIPVGAGARPVAIPPAPIAWSWDAITEVKHRGNKIWINGRPFVRATGHITVAEIKQISGAADTERSRLIARIMRRWFRVHRLRRLLRILVFRSETATSANLSTTVIIAIISIYILLEGSQYIPAEVATAMGQIIPLALMLSATLHLIACSSAWYQSRKLKRWGGSGATESIVSALLFPPHALQLRATLADKYWPPVHPLTTALALGSSQTRQELAQNTWRDLNWPLPVVEQSNETAAEFAREHRARIKPLVEALLHEAGIFPENLERPPSPDSAKSCAYCPRCHDQFVRENGHCPHGIALKPLAK